MFKAEYTIYSNDEIMGYCHTLHYHSNRNYILVFDSGYTIKVMNSLKEANDYLQDNNMYMT